MRKAAVVLAIAVSALISTAAAQTITVPGGGSVGGWGVGGIQTVGQTFTSLNSRLDNFTFWLRSEAGPPISFRAYVFQWDELNFRATGPALYVSGLLVSPVLSSFAPYSFAAATTVTTGGRYVAFLSINSSSGLFASVESSLTDVYAGGTFAYTSLPPMLFAWNTYTGIGGSPPPRDLRFDASFSAVPEPSSVILTAVGLAGVGVAMRRRQRRMARRVALEGMTG